jgi:CRP-like cAMP-binding protein
MALDDDIELLARTSPFDLLPPDALRLIAFSAQKVHFPAETELFAEGDDADCAYFVIAGEIALGDSAPKIVTRGTLIGESAMLIATQRPIRARVYADVVMMKIGREMFARVLAEFPKETARIHARLAARTRATIRDLNALRSRSHLS